MAETYNQGIAERRATFETEARSPAELAHRIEEDRARFPVIVAEDGDRPVVRVRPFPASSVYAGEGGC